MNPLTQQHASGPSSTAIVHESGYIHEMNQNQHTVTHQPMPPGNPTENPELDRLDAEVLEYNEAIKKQNHIRWLAGVEITRLEKSLRATLKSIETITKGA